MASISAVAIAQTPTIAADGSIGVGSTCVVTVGGDVECWGDNSGGKLGVGAVTESPTPVTVTGLPADAKAVSVGDTHACAVLVTGQAACWGANFQGQLGAGDQGTHTSPVIVAGIGEVAAVATGWRHTCALIVDGTVWCWGYNVDGELGDGGNGIRSAPFQVAGISGATSIDVGRTHSCAVVADGGVSCWGDNEYGQIGSASAGDSNLPVAVPGVGDAAELALGEYFSCARLVDGTVSCWGGNWAGQHGDGSSAGGADPTPSTVSINGVVYLSAGGAHACAVTADGAVHCWGANGKGQLGVGDTAPRHTPAQVLSGASGVAAGDDHSCALLTSGAVKCWGGNQAGQIGTGVVSDTDTPTAVTLVNPVSIGVGPTSACAVLSGGTVRCWGRNQYGMLLTGDSDDVASPTAASGLSSVTSIALGSRNGCAISSPSQLRCWGYNGWGAVGAGDTNPHATPTTVSGLSSGAAQVAIGLDFACARTTGGGAKCWGKNDDGQLGDNSNSQRNAPVDVWNMTSNVAEIAVGDLHACALTTGGAVWCWGDDQYGQLGDGAVLADADTPQQVSGLTSGVSHISAAAESTCASMSAGGIKCWGYNNFGQLGKGDASGQSAFPVNVIGAGAAMNVATLNTGGRRSCAVNTAGALWCWGYNYYGELGPLPPATIDEPRQITLPQNAVMADSGDLFTCLLDVTSVVRCLGHNNYGQLGTGTSAIETLPRDVVSLSPVAQPPPVTLRPRPSPLPVAPAPPKILQMSKSGRLAKSIRIRLSCPVGCTLDLKLKIARRVHELRGRKVAPALDTVVNVKLPASLRRAGARALKRNGRAKITFTAQPFAGRLGGSAGTKLRARKKLGSSLRVSATCASSIGCELWPKLKVGRKTHSLPYVKVAAGSAAVLSVTVRIPAAVRASANKALKRKPRTALRLLSRTLADAQRGRAKSARLRS